MVSWSLWSAAAFPSSLRSRSRCLPLKLAEPAVADVVWSQWLPSLSSQRASGSCRHLLASSMSTVAVISSPSSHASLVLQDLCRIERLQARGNQQACLEAQTKGSHMYGASDKQKVYEYPIKTLTMLDRTFSGCCMQLLLSKLSKMLCDINCDPLSLYSSFHFLYNLTSKMFDLDHGLEIGRLFEIQDILIT
uniref:Uncharacterized protein n=1 Tax=Oryza nivara TaxID=4536 RepID=A0A0E0GGR4_ORYNI